MPITVSKLKEEVAGHSRIVTLSVNFGNPYPTGGEPLNRAWHNLTNIEAMTAGHTRGHHVQYDRVNHKLQVFVGGAEVANGTDLRSLKDVRLVIRGE